MNYESEFRKYLEDNMQSADATVSAYVADIKEFETFLSASCKDPERCGREDVRSFLEGLKADGRSGATINRKLVSLRKYYAFLSSEKNFQGNPTEKIKAPKVEHRDLEFLSVEEIDKLLSMPDDSVKGLRDKALMELMYACGLKASEAADARCADMDLRIGFISVQGEGKVRIVPIGRPARSAVLAYLNSSRSKLLRDKEDDGTLFLNYAGERISRQGVWKILKYYGKKAGLGDNFSPQILRNSFAAHMIQNGADLKSLQELLGHEDLAATKLYLSLTKNRVMDVYDRTHPRA